MEEIKNIALVAHDNRKKDLIEWVEWNYTSLIEHKLICTGTTGILVEEALKRKLVSEKFDLHITKLKSGPLGGDQQLGAMIAEGKGEEKTEFFDFESSRGTNPIVTTPDNYISWFDPKGAMNEFNAVSNVNPDVPVLFIGPTRDYPGLVKIKQKVFDMLPKNPLTKLYEPDSSHLQAPSASREEIVQWIDEVLNAKKH